MSKLNILKNIKKYILDNGLLSYNDTVIVGVSGGADSMALLSILEDIQDEFFLNIHACHINHGIRGEEALRDELFVKEYCSLHGIPFRVFTYDVPAFAKQNKLSDEEAGRILRYKSFYALADELKNINSSIKIAIAHNKDDNAETVLLQLLRGSGLKGLSGISKKRDSIIRPILNLSRKDIESYLNLKNIAYITDSSNLSLDYTRNILRNEVFPILNHKINKLSVDNINKAADFISEADSYISKKAFEVFNTCVSKSDDFVCIESSKLKDYEHIIRSYVIRKSLEIFFSKLKDIEAVHVELIDNLIFMESGKKINLPYCSHAYKEYDKIYICENKTSTPLHLPDANNFSFDIIENTAFPISDTKYIKYFDFDKLKELPTIRYRQSGDFIAIKNGNKKIKSFMTDEKISQKIRDSIILIAKGNEIIWILGYRVSEKYKVSSNTKQILKISYKGD